MKRYSKPAKGVVRNWSYLRNAVYQVLPCKHFDPLRDTNEAGKLAKLIFKIIAKELNTGRSVRIEHFGTFWVVRVDAPERRIPARKPIHKFNGFYFKEACVQYYATFRVSPTLKKLLKEGINESPELR